MSLWPKAREGDLAAINLILKVIDQRVKLPGLAARRPDRYDGPKTLVIGPLEGNPGEATG